ncbi:hypothetical protein BDV96DRAFT_649015 [Lophiotrema nucula]|uniref:SRR1-like domain-containing protein n=1 Tax=Lophiotrema nucula TaxID=690887 RepID=A0A6A5Z061_9PLEO|nr:hypothetical protein BDV96DRAFT_649015 [Lophiotrema nucula]
MAAPSISDDQFKQLASYVPFNPGRISDVRIKFSDRADRRKSAQPKERAQLRHLNGTEDVSVSAQKKDPNPAGEKEYVQALVIVWRSYQKLIRGNALNTLTNLSLPMDIFWLPRKWYHGNEFNHRAKQVYDTIEALRKDCIRTYQNDLHTVAAGVGRRINRVIFLGLPIAWKGTKDKKQDFLDSDSCRAQIAAWLLAKVLHGRLETYDPLRIFVQTSRSIKSLGEDTIREMIFRPRHDYKVADLTVVDDITAVDTIDNNTMVVSFSPDFPVKQILADMAPAFLQPPVFICRPIPHPNLLTGLQEPYADGADSDTPLVVDLASAYSDQARLALPQLPELCIYRRPLTLVPQDFSPAFRALESFVPFFSLKKLARITRNLTKNLAHTQVMLESVIGNDKVPITGIRQIGGLEDIHTLKFVLRPKWRSYQEVVTAAWNGKDKKWMLDGTLQPLHLDRFRITQYLPLDIESVPFVHLIGGGAQEFQPWVAAAYNAYALSAIFQQIIGLFTGESMQNVTANKIVGIGLGMAHIDIPANPSPDQPEAPIHVEVMTKYILMSQVASYLKGHVSKFLNTPVEIESKPERDIRDYIFGIDQIEDINETEIFHVVDAYSVVVCITPYFPVRQVLADIILANIDNAPQIVICRTVDIADTTYNNPGDPDPNSLRVQTVFTEQNRVYRPFPLATYLGAGGNPLLNDLTMYVRTAIFGDQTYPLPDPNSQ